MTDIWKSRRLPHWDYSTPGLYFVTFCTAGRKNILGSIETAENSLADEVDVKLSPIGNYCAKHAEKLTERFPGCSIEAIVVMPNHVHALISLSSGKDATPAPDLSAIVRYWKSVVTREAHDLGFSGPVWQKSFHDHIVRDVVDESILRDYVANNPKRWALDELYLA